MLINAYLKHVGDKANAEYHKQQEENEKAIQAIQDKWDARTYEEVEADSYNGLMIWRDMLEKNEQTLSDLREQKKRFDELYGGAGELNKQIREARQSAINCRVIVDRVNYPRLKVGGLS